MKQRPPDPAPGQQPAPRAGSAASTSASESHGAPAGGSPAPGPRPALYYLPCAVCFLLLLAGTRGVRWVDPTVPTGDRVFVLGLVYVVLLPLLSLVFGTILRTLILMPAALISEWSSLERASRTQGLVLIGIGLVLSVLFPAVSALAFEAVGFTVVNVGLMFGGLIFLGEGIGMVVFARRGIGPVIAIYGLILCFVILGWHNWRR